MSDLKDQQNETLFNNKDITEVIRIAQIKACNEYNFCPHYKSSSILREIEFHLLEKSFETLILEIEKLIFIFRKGEYYNSNNIKLSLLIEAASNILRELEFRKGMFWQVF